MRFHLRKNLICRLSAGLLALLLAGCAGTVASPGRHPEGSLPGVTGNTAAPPRSDLPRRDLVFYLPGNVQKDQLLVNGAINDRLLEKINCTVSIQVVDWNLWTSKYPILLSSGEQVDLIFTASFFGYQQEVSKNTFLPLDDLMAKYGQEIPGAMLDGYLEAARVQGKLYGIPVNKDTGQGWGIVANKEMAQEIGTDLGGVVDLEDLGAVLHRAKEKLARGVIPLFLSNDLSMAQITGSTKASGEIGFRDRSRFVQLEDAIYYDNLNRKSMPVYRIPEFVEQCRLVRQWFLEGLINTDVTTTQVTAREAMQQGKAFIHVQAQSPIHQIQWENETGRKLISVSFIPGVKETQSMTGALTALPVGCTDPARAMMVISQFMTDANLKNLFTWGIEGRHYVKVKDNVIKLPEGVKSTADNGYNPGNFWLFGNAYLLDVWDNEPPNKWNLLRVYCDTMPKSPLLGFAYDSTLVKLEAADHANVMKELFPMMINGVLDTDSVLVRIELRDKAAGVDRICAEIDRQVAAWKAGK